MTALIWMCVSAAVLVQRDPDSRDNKRPNQRGRWEPKKLARLAEISTNGQGRVHQEGGLGKREGGARASLFQGQESDQKGSTESRNKVLPYE